MPHSHSYQMKSTLQNLLNTLKAPYISVIASEQHKHLYYATIGIKPNIYVIFCIDIKNNILEQIGSSLDLIGEFTMLKFIDIEDVLTPLKEYINPLVPKR